MASGAVAAIDGRFVPQGDAVRAVRILRGSEITESIGRCSAGRLGTTRSPGGALAASGALHLAVLGCLVLLATWAVATAPEQRDTTPVRLVFLATPGPGGGGGGGGLRQPAPPPKAEKKGTSPLRSPVPPPRPITTRPPDPKPQPSAAAGADQPAPKPVEPPPPPPQPVPLPQVVAPVATAPADPRDKAGVLADLVRRRQSWARGPGAARAPGKARASAKGPARESGRAPAAGPAGARIGLAAASRRRQSSGR